MITVTVTLLLPHLLALVTAVAKIAVAAVMASSSMDTSINVIYSCSRGQTTCIVVMTVLQASSLLAPML